MRGVAHTTRALPEEIEDQWLALTLREPAPFTSNSIDFLIAHIPDPDFMLAATIRWQGVPVSVVLHLRRTVTAAGQRLMENRARETASSPLRRWLTRPIDLYPLTDIPVIAMRGERPCSASEARAIAGRLLRFSRCPVLYQCDLSATGSA